VSTRGERRKRARKRLREAHHSSGTTGCDRSTQPRELLEAYSIRNPGDATIGNYCADPFFEADPDLGFST